MDIKNGIPKQLYIPTTWVVVLVLCMVVLVGLVAFTLFKVYGASSLYKPEDAQKTLGVLGEAPDIGDVPHEKIADVLTERVNAETKGKLTILFFYDGYASQKDAQVYIEVLKASLDEVEPFKSMKDLLAFKIFTTDGVKCRAEHDLLVCDKELIESFRKLGIDRFKVVILSPQKFQSAAQLARGYNSFITISTHTGTLSVEQKKRILGVEFTKLLGRSLGLRSEYSDPTNLASLPAAPPPDIENEVIRDQAAKPNCAPSLAKAQEWWGSYTSVFPTVSYLKGCGGSDQNYYPVAHTLMSDDPYDETYGIVSEDYLRGVLSCFYGEKEAIIFPAGFTATHSATLNNCESFKKDYPLFWEE